MRLVVLVGVLFLTACGSAAPPATPAPSSPPAATASASGGPVNPSEKLMTLRGTVSPGVEAGCTILTAGDKVYELQGPVVAGLRPGAVVVHGYAIEGMMTICQQGTPFRVLEVQNG
jgi:multidrug efflux pump subunit AcrA (membrane-fusion protein)